MKQINASGGQTLLDVAIQEYGCIEGVMMLLDDNNLSMDSELYVGQPLQIRELVPELTENNRAVQGELVLRSIKPNSGVAVEAPENGYVEGGYVEDGYVE